MQEMTGKQRFLATMAGQEADRVPISLLLEPEFVMHSYGEKVSNYYKNIDKCVGAFLNVQRAFPADAIDVTTTLPQLGEVFGHPPSYPDDGYPVLKEPVFNSMEDLAKARIRDIGSIPVFQAKFEVLEQLVGYLGEEVAIGARCTGTFNLARELVGNERLLTAIVMEPDFVHKIASLACEVMIRLGKEYINCGVDFIYYPDGASSPSWISPDQYEEFAMPYHERFFESIKTMGVKTVYHPCGGEYPILCQVRTIKGIDAYHFSELVDPGVSRKIYGPRKVLWASVNPYRTLLRGSPADVKAEVKSVVEKAAQAGNTIIAPGCTLPALTPKENITAMVNAVREFGKMEAV